VARKLGVRLLQLVEGVAILGKRETLAVVGTLPQQGMGLLQGGALPVEAIEPISKGYLVTYQGHLVIVHDNQAAYALAYDLEATEARPAGPGARDLDLTIYGSPPTPPQPGAKQPAPASNGKDGWTGPGERYVLVRGGSTIYDRLLGQYSSANPTPPVDLGRVPRVIPREEARDFTPEGLKDFTDAQVPGTPVSQMLSPASAQTQAVEASPEPEPEPDLRDQMLLKMAGQLEELQRKVAKSQPPRRKPGRPRKVKEPVAAEEPEA